MEEKYSTLVGAWYANVFRYHMRKVMKDDGFKDHTTHADVSVITMDRFEKSGDFVSLTISKETVDRCKVQIHSETLPVREIILKAVANIVTEVGDDFLKPLLPVDRMEEVKQSLRNTIFAGG